MHRKLGDQPECDESTRDVGQDHGGFFTHLQNRRLIVVVEAGLVKGEAAIAERIIHRDEHFAIFVSLEIDQLNPAGKALRNVGAGITIMRKMEEREREGLVEAAAGASAARSCGR